jgi:hypothetical protein
MIALKPLVAVLVLTPVLLARAETSNVHSPDNGKISDGIIIEVLGDTGVAKEISGYLAQANIAPASQPHYATPGKLIEIFRMPPGSSEPKFQLSLRLDLASSVESRAGVCVSSPVTDWTFAVEGEVGDQLATILKEAGIKNQPEKFPNLRGRLVGCHKFIDHKSYKCFVKVKGTPSVPCKPAPDIGNS